MAVLEDYEPAHGSLCRKGCKKMSNYQDCRSSFFITLNY